MVANRHGIVAHEVHHLDFHFTLKHIIIRRSLRDVPAVEQQQVGIRFTRFLYESGTANRSSHAGIAVGRTGGNGFDAAMRIACLQYHQLLGVLVRIGGQQTKRFLLNSSIGLLC